MSFVTIKSGKDKEISRRRTKPARDDVAKGANLC